MATTERFYDKTTTRNERNYRVAHSQCMATVGEIVEKYVHKGSQVHVEGLCIQGVD